MHLNDIIKAINDHPLLSGAIATAFAAVASFVRPILEASQRALIRRIDAAWQEEDDDGLHPEARVQRTVERIMREQSIVPRDRVEREVRKRKRSDPPPKP